MKQIKGLKSQAGFLGKIFGGIGDIIGDVAGGIKDGFIGTVGSAIGGGLSNKISSALGLDQTINLDNLSFDEHKQLQDEFNLFSASEAAKAREFNKDEALKNRNWQQYMSSTAHQRQMNDLDAAGINPILTARYGGASSPGGSAASGSGPSVLQTPSQTVSSAAAQRQVKMQEKKFNAETDLLRSQATKNRAEARTQEAHTKELTYEQERRIEITIGKALADINSLSSSAVAKTLEAELLAEVKIPGGKIDVQQAELVLEELQLRIKQLKDNPQIIRQILAREGGHLEATTSTAQTAIRALTDAYKGIYHTTKELIGTKLEQSRQDSLSRMKKMRLERQRKYGKHKGE